MIVGLLMPMVKNLLANGFVGLHNDKTPHTCSMLSTKVYGIRSELKLTVRGMMILCAL